MIAKVFLVAALAAVSLALPYGAPSSGSAYQEEKYPPQPYEFGYETNDDYGTTTFRKESSDGKKDLHGIERVVEYVADEHGYRAEIKTNEPGTESQNPADVVLHANPIAVEQPQGLLCTQTRIPCSPILLPQYSAPHYPRY
ncbi:cuticle protein 10.9 [Caerostris extrusa]|uniref:Cuticle protein 10.9 n=1 Tax=Caerostris extrusa TaxID=172846 RepID=A0AAV4XMW6_CAEEX|nr:cuticle protein 10.9 [Caerostris extrusa]